MRGTEDTGLAAPPQDEQRRLWIEAFRHARHDWLNDLQMILGYAQLGKYDKLKACVEILKQKLTEESRLAKIGSDRLAELLLTVRARPKNYSFILRIDENFAMPDEAAEQAAAAAVDRMLSAFDAAARIGPAGSANELVCTFAAQGGAAPSISFSYTGAYAEDTLRLAVRELRTSLSLMAPGCVLAECCREGSAAVVLHLPAA